MKTPPALILHRVFLPARRETDRREQFRKRWRRVAEATNFVEHLWQENGL